MSKKEKLLKRYLETLTFKDYQAYQDCPEDVKDKEKPARRAPKESEKNGG